MSLLFNVVFGLVQLLGATSSKTPNGFQSRTRMCTSNILVPSIALKLVLVCTKFSVGSEFKLKVFFFFFTFFWFYLYIDGGKNPTFNHKFKLELIEGYVEIKIMVWNENRVSSDTFIGSGR